MKRDYKYKIETLKTKNKTLLVIAIVAIFILVYLWFIPVECEPVSVNSVMFEGRAVSPRECTNLYGHRMIEID